MKTTATRLWWAVLTAAGLVTATAVPSFAGIWVNHTETFNGR